MQLGRAKGARRPASAKATAARRSFSEGGSGAGRRGPRERRRWGVRRGEAPGLLSMAYEYERVTQPSSGLRLHLNENTAGCSPRVLAALHGITREQAACYPDYDQVTRACADRFGVASDQILLTNGLDEAILGISIAALRPDSHIVPEAIVIVPAFDMYPACADSAGGRVVEVSTGDNFDVPDRIGARGTDACHTPDLHHDAKQSDRTLGSVRPDLSGCTGSTRRDGVRRRSVRRLLR